MRLTVAICTWNRASLLDRTLARIAQDETTGLEWEVLVVNNNCTDDTDAVIARHQRHLPVRRILERRQGLSNARNAAAMAARGDLIVWTDDDVLVGDGWLRAYERAARLYSESSFFGGPIVPEFEGAAPKWLMAALPHVGGVYGTLDLGVETHELTPSALPFGGNFAVRTAIQRSYLYDPDVGRIGKGMLSGEETTVMLRMLGDGYSGQWLPDATLQHFVPRERQTARHIRRYHSGSAETQERRRPCGKGPLIFGRPRGRLCRLVIAELWYRIRRLSSPPEVWIKDLIRVGCLEGEWRGLTPPSARPCAGA